MTLWDTCECGSRAFDEAGFCGRCGCYCADKDRLVGIDDNVLEAAASERAEAFVEVGPRKQAPPNERWCIGCSPDNCSGCR